MSRTTGKGTPGRVQWALDRLSPQDITPELTQAAELRIAHPDWTLAQLAFEAGVVYPTFVARLYRVVDLAVQAEAHERYHRMGAIR